MFDPTLAEIRFGCGLSPKQPAPQSVDQILSGLTAPDDMASRFPIEPFETFQDRVLRDQLLSRNMRRGPDEEIRQGARENRKTLRRDTFRASKDWAIAHVARRIETRTGFRERLESFWGDHFTGYGKGGTLRYGTSPYLHSILRPRMTGLFEDLLFEAVTHPMMVLYLDQARSVGPQSIRARQKPGTGLNENLAREVLELHTLGVDGPYSQSDVRALATLMAGLTAGARKGRLFKKDFAEPGQKTVLGQTYSGARPGLRDTQMVLRDLARHPATARHIAGKLIRHFVTDTPDSDHIAQIEQEWLRSGGDLMRVYQALLSHPAAWNPQLRNVKWPFDYVTSACRALDVPVENLTRKSIVNAILSPVQLMGQPWQNPLGPDGLAESDSAWITPQGMAARVQWAMAIPGLLRPDLPDPRDFLTTALGANTTQTLRFAASAAETRNDGIGLVLAAPAFQRS
jgi:uncharacterized protein (DUF1800 family)